MRKSTRADIAIEDLLGQITSKRLTTTHKGKTQQFILEWLELVCQYEDLTPLAANFQPVMKKAMLQHSLVGYKPFYDVKTAEDLEVKKGRAAIDYDAYIIVVHQVAANYDNRHSFKQKQRNDIQQVNQTNIHYEETDFGQIQDSMVK